MFDIISLLSTDGYIMCNKKLIRLFGGDCAILIGELCAEYNYYNSIGRLEYHKDYGYMFYATQDTIEQNTGINAHFQRKAISTLSDANIIKVIKKGLPARNYFWINTDELIKLFTKSTTSGSPDERLEVYEVNINNNKQEIINNNSISKDISKSEKPKRKSLYDKCLDEINEFTDDTILKETLVSYLSVRLVNKEKPLLGVNQWKGMLKKLSSMDKQVDVVLQSIDRGWASFFELKLDYNKSDVTQWNGNKSVVSIEMTNEDKDMLNKDIEERKQNGKRIEF